MSPSKEPSRERNTYVLIILNLLRKLGNSLEISSDWGLWAMPEISTIYNFICSWVVAVLNQNYFWLFLKIKFSVETSLSRWFIRLLTVFGRGSPQRAKSRSPRVWQSMFTWHRCSERLLNWRELRPLKNSTFLEDLYILIMAQVSFGKRQIVAQSISHVPAPCSCF